MTPPRHLDAIKFDDQGLIPSIVQDWSDGTVLMVGFMNQQAVEETLRTHYVHFWSRSRNRIWQKGESSGHHLLVKSLFIDCDRDTILVKAEPVGPTCHTGARSCFFAKIQESGIIDEEQTTEAHGGILDRLYRTILERKQASPEKSYVASLMKGGTDRILKKVVEESGEVVLAAKNEDRGEIIYEIADLMFHAFVTLGYFEIPPEEIYRELERRFGQSGLQKREGTAPT